MSTDSVRHSTVTHIDERILIHWLQDRDAACPLCGYNLRGLISPRCPECGQTLRLSVTLAEPYLKAWIAMIAGLLPVAGIGAIYIVVIVYVVMRSGIHIRSGDFPPLWILYVLGHAILSVPLSIAAIVFRRRFLAWNRRKQQVCAGLVWLAVVITIVTMASKIP